MPTQRMNSWARRRIEVELAPLVDLAQRVGRRHALVVAAVRGDRVIHVDDRRHLRQFRNLAFVLHFRIAAAVAPFVVVQGDVERDLSDFRRLAQEVVAVARMLLDDREFLVGQAPGLVQDTVRHQRLAGIVQQAADAGLVDRFIVHAARAAEGHQQRADADRVQEGVVVLGLDAHQAEQGAVIAQDRLGNAGARQATRFPSRPPCPGARPASPCAPG